MQLAWPIIIIVTWVLLLRLDCVSFHRLGHSASTNPQPAAPAVCCITDQPNRQLPDKNRAVRAGGRLPKAAMPPLSMSQWPMSAGPHLANPGLHAVIYLIS